MLNLKRLGIVPYSRGMSDPQKVWDYVRRMLRELTVDELATPEVAAVREAWGTWLQEQAARREKQQRAREVVARRVATPYIRRMLQNPEPNQDERIAMTSIAENTAGLRLWVLRRLGSSISGPDDDDVPVTVPEELTYQVREYVNQHGWISDWTGDALGIVLLRLKGE